MGAMHDSFPHALELSKLGYNAFALIYRPGDAYEDLARAGTIAEGWLQDAIRFWQQQSGATAIRSAKANTKPSDTIYSLNGTRRHAMQKGVSIIKGKKIITK